MIATGFREMINNTKRKKLIIKYFLRIQYHSTKAKQDIIFTIEKIKCPIY